MSLDFENGEELVVRATAVLKGQDSAKTYCVHIKEIQMFWLKIKYVGFGASFHCVSWKVTAAQE